MPEGDSLVRAARTLHRAFAGVETTRAELRVPSLATLGARLEGRRTIEVVSIGKHLLHRFEGNLTLHTHLRMEGRWRLHRSVAARRVIAAGTARDRIRALLATQTTVALGERLGMVDLVTTDQEARLVGHLGPDIMAPGFDPGAVLPGLLQDPRPIAEALLDQRLVAGLGTLWVSESLYAIGLWPWTPCSQVTPESAGAVLTRARRDMLASVAEPGGRRRRPAVHAQIGRACERCWSTIRSGSVGREPTARVMPYCPGCQRQS